MLPDSKGLDCAASATHGAEEVGTCPPADICGTQYADARQDSHIQGPCMPSFDHELRGLGKSEGKLQAQSPRGSLDLVEAAPASSALSERPVLDSATQQPSSPFLGAAQAQEDTPLPTSALEGGFLDMPGGSVSSIDAANMCGMPQEEQTHGPDQPKRPDACGGVRDRHASSAGPSKSSILQASVPRIAAMQRLASLDSRSAIHHTRCAEHCFGFSISYCDQKGDSRRRQMHPFRLASRAAAYGRELRGSAGFWISRIRSSGRRWLHPSTYGGSVPDLLRATPCRHALDMRAQGTTVHRYASREDGK